MASFSSRGFAMSGAPSASFAVRSIQRRSSALRGADSTRLSSATVGSCASNGVRSASSLKTFIGAADASSTFIGGMPSSSSSVRMSETVLWISCTSWPGLLYALMTSTGERCAST